MKQLRSTILYTILLIACTATATAQGPGFDDDVEDTPIDGGATIMLVAAAGYGIKKMKDEHRKKTEK